MHDALSGERLHGSKNGVVGYYTGGREGVEGRGGGERERDKRLEKCVVRVDLPRGTHFRTMGVADGANRMWLLPEEALYLVERGGLDVRWGVRTEDPGEDEEVEGSPGGDELEEEEEEDKDDDAPSLSDLPMSLQGAYATFISDEDLTLARYTVFAGLRRSGYTVVRAPTWDDSDPLPDTQHEDTAVSHSTALPQEETAPSSPPPRTQRSQSLFSWSSLRNFITRIFHSLFRSYPSKPYQRHPNPCPSLGPLVAPGLYRSYADIYRALTLIPFHDPLSQPSDLLVPNTTTPSSTRSPVPPPEPPTPSTSTNAPIRITYHVYKPTTPYRKTSPGSPDFHLSVIDARSHPIIPNLTQLGSLLEEMPIHDPRHDEKLKWGRPEMRLKAGTRSVVLAVVDNGVVSFLRVGEMGSGRERIFEERVARGGGGKRGGWKGRGWSGRGRGRGRGR